MEAQPVEIMLWGSPWFTVVVDILIAAWGVVLLGIGFIIIQHIPEHTKQLEQMRIALDSINERLGTR